MPSTAARQLYEDQLPSFMSVISPEPSKTHVADSLLAANFSRPAYSVASNSQTLDVRQSSILSRQQPASNGDSAASTPSTTPSSSDSSPLSDPSPSSPESPIHLPTFKPLSADPPFTVATTLSKLSITRTDMLRERPMTSPAPRRARNMKNLSIMPPLMSGSVQDAAADPSSPSFIKPKIPAMKRKPSNLSLDTNSHELPKGSNFPLSPGMGSMTQRRALKHSVSTPHMLTGLKSSTFAPPGGMSFPVVLERNEGGLSEALRPSKAGPFTISEDPIEEDETIIRTQIAGRVDEDVARKLRDESENNEDLKSPTYPTGPIAIYDDNVFLYLEPKAEEAARFDLVINVAREVKNPFEHSQGASATQSPVVLSPIPDTAATDASFATAFEFPEAKTPLPQTKLPEYIHMPWDHNTDISVDLMQLCHKIDQTVKQKKKVLIHCQQGASRSASLIIAYGLYRNPSLTVNDAYYAAQAKSRWISPNMKLMYCLQDFQKQVSTQLQPPASALRQRAGRSPIGHRFTHSEDINSATLSNGPLTAPLLAEDNGLLSPGQNMNGRSPMRLRGNSTPSSLPITPGPSSAPSSFSWTEAVKNNPGAASFPRFALQVGEPSPTLSPPSNQASGAPPGIGPAMLAPSSAGSSRSSNMLKPMSLGKPPPSPGFVSPMSFAAPPKSPGFISPMSFDAPPKSPGFVSPMSFDEPPRSPGFISPMSFDEPPKSPGFVSPMTWAQPPSSPGFPPAGMSSFGGFHQSIDESLSRNCVATVPPAVEDDLEASLMSPRAEVMTNNPLRHAFPPPPKSTKNGFTIMESPPSPDAGILSPRNGGFPADPFGYRPSQVADPRSPPTKGETPIVRSIDEVL